jgi:hypothetical protein
MALSRLAQQQPEASEGGSPAEPSSPDGRGERSVESSRSPSPSRGGGGGRRAGSVTTSGSAVSSMADLAVRMSLFGGVNARSITATGVLRPPALSPRRMWDLLGLGGINKVRAGPVS